MQHSTRFKSAKCSSKQVAKVLSVLSAFVFAAGLTSTFASALTVHPAGGGGPTKTDSVLWYAGAKGSVASYVMDSGAPGNPHNGRSFYAVDLLKTQYDEENLENALTFYLSSSAPAPTSGGTSYLIVTMSGQGASALYPVAIAGVNGSTCKSGTSGCVYNYNGQERPDSSHRNYFAVPWVPGSTGGGIQISLYMHDVCTSFNNLSGGSGVGCVLATGGYTAGLQTTPTTDSVVSPVALKFQIVTLPSAMVPTTLPAATEEASANLRFEDNKRSEAGGTPLSCPATPVTYFPADASILVDTSMWDSNALSTPGGYAPILSAIVVGATSGSGLTFPTPQPTGYPTSISAFDRVGLGANQMARGFTNIEAASDPAHTYDVGFLLVDAAGVVYTPAAAGSNPPGCTLVGVQTSAIQGFLSKSSCFIATAAFRSIDASPVAMLRRFRDEILFQSEFGTAFVHWYYSWSPAAAEWLMRHPYLRYPVLQALLPMELGAWLWLHLAPAADGGSA